jgi:hypothetical protein
MYSAKVRTMPKASLITTAEMPPWMFAIEGDRSYILARLIYFAGGDFAGRAGYLGQMALEMYLKAISVAHDNTYKEIHKLLELAEYCARFDAEFTDKDLLDGLKLFDNFDQVGRYGGAAKFDPHAKKTDEFEVSGVVLSPSGTLEQLDQLVYTIRGKLDFSKSWFTNDLRAILTGDKTARIVAAWTLPIPIRDVLTTNNRYFR